MGEEFFFHDLNPTMVRLPSPSPRTAWGAFDLVLGADLLLDSRHCDAFRAALRPLLRVSPEILLMERNRSGAGSRCVTEIVADGFWAEEARYQRGLSHVVVDDLSDPPWLHEEASEAIVVRVREKERPFKMQIQLPFSTNIFVDHCQPTLFFLFAPLSQRRCSVRVWVYGAAISICSIVIHRLLLITIQH